MWAIKNETPYAAERTWVRDKNGAHRWIVAVKATFDIRVDGAVRLADEQVPPHHVPEHYGEPAGSSLRYEADLVPEKSTTDILLNAHAHAPGGRPTRTVTVAFRVGALTKELRVHGSRVFHRPLVSAVRTAVSEWGDMGAASGALLSILALRAWARGYARGPTALVWASSEGGLRGAVLLRRAESEGRL